MKNILVLCIGNICRSPMAEALLQRALPDKTVHSAGIGALVGNAADSFAIQLMAEQGVDINAHRARQVSARMVNEAELILTMDLEQKKYVEAHFPAARGKVFRLNEAAKVDIADPYKEGIDSFSAALRLIESGVQSMAVQIQKMS